MFRRRMKGKTIGQMRREIREKQVVRGLCLGLSTPQIAKQLHVSSDTVRDLAATPEVQTALAEYERDHFEALDRRFRYSMNLAMEEFVRQLKKKNWKAVERMLTETGILGRMMEYYLGKLERGSRSVAQANPVGVIAPEAMSDEMRQKAREMMQLARKALPEHAASLLPDIQARLTAIHNNGLPRS